MNGIERMSCPECGTENPMLGVVEGTRQYLCKKCGQAYYTPDSCLRTPEESAEKKPEGPKTPPKSEARPKAEPGSPASR